MRPSDVLYTPGPWHVGYGDGLTGPRMSPLVHMDTCDAACYEIPIRRDDEPVAWILQSYAHAEGKPWANDSTTLEAEDLRAKADAALISAAPEMFELLLDIAADGRFTQLLLDANLGLRFLDIMRKAAGPIEPTLEDAE